MAKVLVTGAGGKIGQVLMKTLADRGHTSIGLYRSRRGDDGHGRWSKADITDPQSYAVLLEDCDAVIHLAVSFEPQTMFCVNVEATRELVNIAGRAGVRYFGLTSSVAVYGTPNFSVIDETIPPVDPSQAMGAQYLATPLMHEYARTKRLAEILVESSRGDMTVDIYRPTVVVRPDELREIGNWSPARKTRNANRLTRYVTTIDVAAAMVHLMEIGLKQTHRKTVEIYNIGDDASGTYSELFDGLHRQTADPRFRVPLKLPRLVDRIIDMVRNRNWHAKFFRQSGRISSSKLAQTGFILPMGITGATMSDIRP